MTEYGDRRIAEVIKATSIVAPLGHKMVSVELEDRRSLLASAGHPLIDESTIADLAIGSVLDHSRVSILNHVTYESERTYDLLPDGETGFFFANDIPVASTLMKNCNCAEERQKIGN